MTDILSQLTEEVCKAVNTLNGAGYSVSPTDGAIQLQKTRKEFEGDFTINVFPFVSKFKKSPEQTAQAIGEYVKQNMPLIKSFNVIKGFLNFVIDENYWIEYFINHREKADYGCSTSQNKQPFVIEYSSPNTNKPLHLGHIRNNLLGFSLAEILKATGKNVVKVNLVNDRGIHICKSMLAWKRWGQGETPETYGLKGDHLVGKYYVLFDKQYKIEIEELKNKGISEEDAKRTAPLIIEAQEMLKKWEMNDEEVVALWKRMNSWVYAGFDETYKRLGVSFDKFYYESQTYLLGKSIVEEGLKSNTLEKREDGSVWADLRQDGLDEKLLLRSDGTSVYMTQDLGTAHQRYEEYKPAKMIYVVGNEQNYHFDVLKIILKKMGFAWADDIFHFSYGMIELPEGKMKSREGTVVDADDLVEEMIATAKQTTEELGKIDVFQKEEAEKLYKMLALGALKYFILKVDPKKTMLFNPAESIDFNGNTGPFIQYTHARIQSLLRKAKDKFPSGLPEFTSSVAILPKEKELMKLFYDFPSVVVEAADKLSPALIANYVYELVKEFNQFYQEIPVLKEENLEQVAFRIHLAEFTGKIISQSMKLLGIEVPDRM